MPTILYVDEKPDTRAIFCHMLRAAGYDAVAGQNAEDAQAKMATNPVDLVVVWYTEYAQSLPRLPFDTDSDLQGYADFDAVPFISRLHSEHPDLPIIVASINPKPSGLPGGVHWCGKENLLRQIQLLLPSPPASEASGRRGVDAHDGDDH